MIVVKNYLGVHQGSSKRDEAASREQVGMKRQLNRCCVCAVSVWKGEFDVEEDAAAVWYDRRDDAVSRHCNSTCLVGVLSLIDDSTAWHGVAQRF